MTIDSNSAKSSYSKLNRIALSKSTSSIRSLLYRGSRAAILTATLSIIGTTTAFAVTALSSGQTLSGSLTEQSLTDEYDNTPYNLYLYQGTPGKYVDINLKSSDIDAFLIAGGDAKNSSDCADCETDDDGGDDYNSQLLYLVPEGGNVYVRAGTVNSEYGSYTLSAKELNNPAMANIQDLRLNSTKSGRLRSSSALTAPGRYFDLYMVKGEPNALISVTLKSDDFDAYLADVSVRGNDITEIDYNDDSNYAESDTDARLKVRLDDTGKALIQATSYDNLETGRYSIEALTINEAKEIKAQRRLRSGQSVNGRLDANGMAYLGDYYFDAYRLTGLPGERITVSVSSDDFDTVLKWGYMKDGKFAITQENDDANDGSDDFIESEGTDSELTVILDRDGKNVMMVTSYEEGATGSYFLEVK